MIAGEFDEWGDPYVRCRLVIPRLRTEADVRFLIDTGSNITLLHPSDFRQAEIQSELLAEQSGTGGIGGSTVTYPEPAALHFIDDDGITRYIYHLDIHIAQPDAYNNDFPSLIGMDILSCWYTECDPTNDILRFTVRRIL